LSTIYIDSVVYCIREENREIFRVHILQRNLETEAWHELSLTVECSFFSARFKHFPDYQCILVHGENPYRLIKYDFSSGVVNSKLFAEDFSGVLFRDLDTAYPCVEYQGRLVMVTISGMLFDIDSEEKFKPPVNSQIPPSLQTLPSWLSNFSTSHRFDFLESSLLLYDSIQEKNKKRKQNAKDTIGRMKYLVKHYILWFENSFQTQRFLLPYIPFRSHYIKIILGGNGTFMLYESGTSGEIRRILLFT